MDRVSETIQLIITKLTDETIVTLFLFSGLVGLVVVATWIYNRRKFNQMSHQIPAEVVKNYLDSIIQNSTALKSSLFRGGGLDVQDGVPSIVSASELPSSPISVNNGDLTEELNQKNAELSALRNQLSDKEKLIMELQDKLSEMPAGEGGDQELINSLKGEIEDLKAQLQEAQASAGAGGDEALQKQLEEVTQERDELKERLQEYEIIEEDLANLKRLQQENEQLKKSLEQAGGQVESAAPEPQEAPAAEEAPAQEAAPKEDAAPVEDQADEDLEAAMAQAIEEGGGEAESAEKKEDKKEEKKAQEDAPPQKSAEELLSEFEKMLG